MEFPIKTQANDVLSELEKVKDALPGFQTWLETLDIDIGHRGLKQYEDDIEWMVEAGRRMNERILALEKMLSAMKENDSFVLTSQLKAAAREHVNALDTMFEIMVPKLAEIRDYLKASGIDQDERTVANMDELQSEGVQVSLPETIAALEQLKSRYENAAWGLNQCFPEGRAR